MLKRCHRMNRDAFSSVKTEGVSHYGAHAALTYTTKPASTSTFAVVVSRKVAPTAVARHVIRRRVYEVLREMLPLLTRPVQGIVFVKPGSAKLPFRQLKHELQELFKRAALVE